jgi:hypothetical protein
MNPGFVFCARDLRIDRGLSFTSLQYQASETTRTTLFVYWVCSKLFPTDICRLISNFYGRIWEVFQGRLHQILQTLNGFETDVHVRYQEFLGELNFQNFQNRLRESQRSTPIDVRTLDQETLEALDRLDADIMNSSKRIKENPK